MQRLKRESRILGKGKRQKVKETVMVGRRY